MYGQNIFCPMISPRWTPDAKASVCRFKPPEGDCKARISKEQPALVGFKMVARGFSLWLHCPYNTDYCKPSGDFYPQPVMDAHPKLFLAIPLAFEIR